MTELAAGAVSSLLVVVRNEALLLGGVRDDVQFIKEEMESMKSFLAHLARSTPPGREHDEQVRTWMNQVRLLAQDCHNCIDLYLYSGNPDIHRAKGRFRRYLWWVYWFLHKLLAQHRAAVQLRQLKDRARDVGERRLRYGVEVPVKSGSGQSPPTAGRLAAATASSSARTAAPGGYAAAAAAGVDNEEEDGDDDQLVAAMATGGHSGRRALIHPRTLDDYVKAKLQEWVQIVPSGAAVSLSMVIMTPYTYQDLLALVQEIWVSKREWYQRKVVVDIPAVHPDFNPLRAKEVLFYIQRQLKIEKSQPQPQPQPQEQGPDEDKGDYWDVYIRKLQIYHEKKRALSLLKIKENIKEMKVHEKLDKIKRDIQGRLGNDDGLPKGYKLQGELDHLDLDVLLQLLLHPAVAGSQQDQGKNKDIHIPEMIVKKLKEHMEAEIKDKTLEEEEVTKDMGFDEGEAAGKNMEDHEGDGEVTMRMKEDEEEEEKEGGGEGEEAAGKNMEEEEGEEEEEDDGDNNKEDDDDDKEEEDEEEDDDDEEEEDDDDKEEEDEEEDDDDEEEDTKWIHLDEAQYAHILRNLFPKSMSSSSRPLQAQERSLMSKQATKNTTATFLGEDEIKQIIHDAKKDIIRELQEVKYDKGEGTGESAVPDQNPKTVSKKIGQMIDDMKQEFKEQLKIKGLVEEIRRNLNDHHRYLNRKECTLFILKVDELMDVSTLEDTRNALSLLNNSSDIMIITTTKEDIQVAKEYCYPQVEPINYSLAGLYHDKVLELTSQLQKKNEDRYYDDHHLRIFHDILDECEPHEFCMKIFTHALHANPKRSTEELLKLQSTLQDLPASFNRIAKVMFKFSYNDLPKEYKSCLLYLAIFPPGHKIRRSTLIGRWVAEGLTSKEDWHSSVRQANRCFDALVDRCLVYPADIGAAGNVKSCVVGEPVHGIITTIARKQHILEIRLSHHLARHFSIFNDLQLRSSDRIDRFFQGLSRSSRVSMLKVLDLEGCKCFTGKNQRYLKDICRKMLLLKYLSLRRTNITQLPREINNLRELEVLDIRQTEVPPDATANILLLKLKRLLAGQVGLNYPSSFGSASSSGRIPHKIYKMVNMEVLSNVKAQRSHDLQDIGNLWQLRKLGVVIDDKDSHVKKLLQTISDLHECLRSLSITIIPIATPTPREAFGTTPIPVSADELPADGNDNDNGIGSVLEKHPKILHSLSIRGTTHKGSLLSLFIKGNKNILAKVTLSDMPLTKDDLKFLAKLPMLRCVRLQHIACTDTEHMLAFEKDEFISLKYLLVEGSDLTNITFVDGSAPELEKMVLSFTSTGSISGAHYLPKLEELELNNSFCGRLLSSFDDAEQIAKLSLRGTELEQNALQILAKKPNIRSLVLLERSFSGRQNETIIFKEDEFLWLNLLVVNCSAISEIAFTSRSAPRLDKVVWSSSTSLSGIEKLPRLKELEFNGGQVPDEVRKAIDKHQNKPILKLNGPETQD